MKEVFDLAGQSSLPCAQHVPVLVVAEPNLPPVLGVRVRELCGTAGWPSNGGFDLLTVWNDPTMIGRLVQNVQLAYQLHGTRRIVIAFGGQSADYMQGVSHRLRADAALQRLDIAVSELRLDNSSEASENLVIACIDAQQYGQDGHIAEEVQAVCEMSGRPDILATPGGVLYLSGLADDHVLCDAFAAYVDKRCRNNLKRLLFTGHVHGYGCGAFGRLSQELSLMACLDSAVRRWGPRFSGLQIERGVVSMRDYPLVDYKRIRVARGSGP